MPRSRSIIVPLRWSPASSDDTAQARTEAEIAAALGYDAALLSLGAWRDAPEARFSTTAA